MENLSEVEKVFIKLENIFDNYEDYDRRIKAYEIINELLYPEKLNEATVSERNLLFGFIEFSNHLETERSQIPKSRANIYLAHKNK